MRAPLERRGAQCRRCESPRVLKNRAPPRQDWCWRRGGLAEDKPPRVERRKFLAPSRIVPEHPLNVWMETDLLGKKAGAKPKSGPL